MSERSSLPERLRNRRRPGGGLLSRLPGIAYQCRGQDLTMELMEGAVEAITGLSAEELVAGRGVSFRGLIHPADRNQVLDIVRWDGDDPHEYEVQYRIRAADGVEKWLWERGHGVFSETGELLGLEGFIEDISSLRAAQEERRATNQLLRSVLDQSLVGVFLIQDGELTYANQKLSRILGRSPDQLSRAGGAATAILLPEDRSALEAEFRRLLTGKREEVRTSVRVRAPDGRTLTVEVHASAAVVSGRPAIVGTVLDLTKRLAIENQYREAQKLEAVARMASGIAHDFNNLLTAITGTARLAIERLLGEEEPDIEAAITDFQDILTAARQEAYLTRQLLTFSRRHNREEQQPRGVIDLSDVIRQSETLIRRVVADRITIELRPTDRPLNVIGDMDQLQQVLLNLVMNAEDAMPRGGRVIVSVESCPTEEIPSSVGGGGDAEWVRLLVQDEGQGIPPGIQARIFEPFFTTKERGKGTGLGLSSAYGIIRDHGGLLTVESELGRGSTFIVNLPRTDEVGVVAEEPRQEITAAVGGAETLLVVDDDDAVRRVLARMLQRHGYRVLEAATPETAMVVAGRNADDIDMLVTDVGLPQMRGSELAEAIRHIVPGLPVLLISGYSEAELQNRNILATDWHFLEKPFDPLELAARVRTVLDQEASSARDLDA